MYRYIYMCSIKQRHVHNAIYTELIDRISKQAETLFTIQAGNANNRFVTRFNFVTRFHLAFPSLISYLSCYRSAVKLHIHGIQISHEI